jgi:prefoldin subunit 5
MLGYLLWLLVGVGIGVYAAPTVSEAKAQLLRRVRDLEGGSPLAG